MKRVWPLALLPVLFVAFFTQLASSGGRDDAYVVVRRASARADGEPTALGYAAADDPGRARVQRLMAEGFPAELLRTLAMTRRYVRRTSLPPALVHARASGPVYVALGADDTFQGAPYRDRVIGHGPFAARVLADAPVIWVDDTAPLAQLAEEPDAEAMRRLVAGFGRAIVSLVAPVTRADERTGRWSSPLEEGYVAFLQVVAAEWRVRPHGDGDGGDGDRGADVRDALRRSELFATVRANGAVLRAGVDTDRDPEVIATVLYRMASSELGRRLAPDDTYLPFLEDRPPRGIPAALLLGAFRSFQAKLLSAWAAADRAGHGPKGLRDLIDAYATAQPWEAPEAERILRITTALPPAPAESVPAIGWSGIVHQMPLRPSERER